MNAHPKDRSERRKISGTKKRREALLNEALKKQEAEDERRAKAEREHQIGIARTDYPELLGSGVEDIRTNHTL